MSEEEGSLFIPDNPISSIKEDQFRHQEYVDTLERIVEDADPPWHVGLFGEWGSGKTSVIRLLSQRYDSNPDVIAVEFDAWKHAEESIRAELLLELDERIGEEVNNDGSPILGENRITEQLYDVSEEQQRESRSEGFIKSIDDFFRAEWALASTVFVIGLIVLGASIYIGPGAGTAVATVILVPLLVFMAKRLSEATNTLQRKFLYPRREWSGAFERIFEQILDEVEAEKIIISIDNLDRCESRTAYEVLISMKTFLDNNRCIYFVPCDDDALRSQVGSIDRGKFLKQTENAEEFLRKFFEVRLRIDSLLQEDAESYIRQLNNQLDPPYETDVLDVLTSAYIDNPRHLKHALNRLRTINLLAQELEESDAPRSLKEGRVTSNKAFLAKMTVVQSDFPEFYALLEKDPGILKDTREYLRGTMSQHELSNNAFERLETDSGSETRLKSFLRSTITVQVETPRPFIELCEPTFSSNVGDLGPFQSNLQAGRSEQVSETIMATKARNESLIHYCNATEEALEQYARNNRQQPFQSTISVSLDVLNSYDPEHRQELASIIHTRLTTALGRTVLPGIDVSKIFEMTQYLPIEKRSEVLNLYVARIKEGDTPPKSDIQVFTEFPEFVPNKIARDLCDAILTFDGQEAKDAIEAFSGGGSRILATQNLIQRTCEFVYFDSSQTEFQLGPYPEFDSVASPKTRGKFVQKLVNECENVDSGIASATLRELIKNLDNIKPEVTTDSIRKVSTEVQSKVDQHDIRKPDIFRTIFDYQPNFDEESWEEFLKWTGEKFESWQTEIVKEIVEDSIQGDASVLEHERVVDEIINRIPGDFADQSFVVQTFAKNLPEEFNDQLAEQTQTLIRNNNNQYRDLGAELYLAYPERCTSQTQSIITEARENTRELGKRNNSDLHSKVEKTAFSDLEDPEREQYLQTLLESIRNGDQTRYEVFQEIWEGVASETTRNQKQTVGRELQDELERALDGNTDPQQLSPVIKGWINISENLGEEHCKETIDRLGQAFLNNRFNQHSYVSLLNDLSTLPQLYGTDEQLLDRITQAVRQYSGSADIEKATEQFLKDVELSDDLNEEKVSTLRKEIE